MFARITLLLITVFWLCMNFLLWRSEYGNDRHWADVIGKMAAARGADGFWPGLTSGFAA